MAEVIALGASIIAIIQIADRVIGLCKHYIETVHDAPSDLRVILIEISATKTILENLQFLVQCNNGSSAILDSLSGANGPIEGCRNAIAKMEELFPSDYAQGFNESSSIRQKIKSSFTALAWPLKESKAKKLVEEVIRYKSTINLALTAESTHDIKDIKVTTKNIQEALSESQRAMVYQWLEATAPDPSPLHHRACNQYEPGTADWMLRSSEWKDWLDGKTRCFWIYGIPGAGKTVLASYLIEGTKEYCRGSTVGKCAYAFYYCYFGHGQEEAEPFLRWTISRLCRQADQIPTYLYELYTHGGQPSLMELLGALEAILEIYDNVYIIIDAIDESKPRNGLLRVLRDLATDLRFQKVHVLATSRQYIDIETVMQEISVSVSMLHPLLTEDIRLYVASQMEKNPKFKHWSPQLREEVAGALANGAKGMFRWAACQIHTLQRLKPETKIVRKTLANLPKTLDETYERIFLEIPDDDRLFVHQALKWIYYHNELRQQNISCSILLQAIEKSIAQSTSSNCDYYYNEELLRESCGCLITVTSETRKYKGSFGELSYPTQTVAFAHYTVLEFLESNRILNTSASFFAVMKEKLHIELTRTTILEVLDTQPSYYDLWNRGAHLGLLPSLLADALDNDFNSYCVVTSIFSIVRWMLEISKQEDLGVLILNLIDPSWPHFQDFTTAIRYIEDTLYFMSCRGSRERFWRLTWATPLKNKDSAIFVNLLHLDKTCSFAKSFVGTVNLREMLKAGLDIRPMPLPLNLAFSDPLNLAFDDRISVGCKGTIVELLAQRSRWDWGFDGFKLLLELGSEYLDPSILMLSFISSHNHETCIYRACCPFSRLLELGASINNFGYMVTLLQITVRTWDFAGVKFLLEAGADPNNTGDMKGREWGKDSILAPYNCLHGQSPLRICKECRSIPGQNIVKSESQTGNEIESILLQYGARNIEIRGV